ERPLLLVPLAPRRRAAGGPHPGRLEEPRQPLAEGGLPRLALEAGMEIVDPGDRDREDAALQEVVDDLPRHEVARRLHDDLDPALPAIADGDALDRGIGDLPPHRLEQRLAARE